MCIKPTLVFLHGFLGSKEDWNPLISYLEKNFRCLALDLYPFFKKTDTFQKLSKKIHHYLQKNQISSYHLIGYSLGGRISLALSQVKQPLSLSILSAHFGLQSLEDKKAREQQDLEWEKILHEEGQESFLEKWYSQCLFSPETKSDSIQRRLSQNLCSKILGSILQNFTLGKQPFYLNHLPQHSLFFYGENDEKYKELYTKTLAPEKRIAISSAHHSIHLENPRELAYLMRSNFRAVNDY